MTDVRSYIEIDIPLAGSTPTGAIPSVTSIRLTPTVVDPGVSIGQRASLDVTMRDFQYPLAGSAFNSGTFFGKLRAHRNSLQGLYMRLIREAGDREVTEHYVIESLMRSGGDMVTLTAKDLYKVADGDRSQAPAQSRGRVFAEIDEAATEITLTPTGIGSLEYPVSGKCAIGGSEICSFTRSGDVMTLVRAQSGTTAVTHDADEVVQLVLIYDALSPAEIFYDLLATYTEIDTDWLPLAEWQADIDAYIGRLYSAEIAVPTSVKTLLDEIVSQCGLVTWWDAVNQQVRLRSLRPVTGARAISTDEMMADTFSVQEQPSKRVSEVWTYFALRSPLAKLDDPASYRSTLVTVDPNTDVDYEGQPAIRKIFSRWIAINNRPAASRINSLMLSRYRDPPRKFSFELFVTSDPPELGQGIEVEHWSLQDEDGNIVTAPAQITSIENEEDRMVIDAEEMLFTSILDSENPEGSRLIVIDSDSFNLNLRTLHDSFYADAVSGDEVLCIIEANVVVGSTNIAVPSFDVGDWDTGVVVTVRVQGIIQGKGGADAEQGGPALYTRFPVVLDNQGLIWGGGGGGSVTVEQIVTFDPFNITEVISGGGGGAGFDAGTTTVPGSSNGTMTAGGDPYGGDPGEAGGTVPGYTYPGGAAGAGIDGFSYVSFIEGGDIRGPQVN
jgi:hypothetical protein